MKKWYRIGWPTKSKIYLVETPEFPERSKMSEFDSPFLTISYRACIVKDEKIVECYENKGLIKDLTKNVKPVKRESIPNYTGTTDTIKVYVLSSGDLPIVEDYADKKLIKSITEGCELQIMIREYRTKWWDGS